jgi:hypothetical protein
VYNLPTHVKWVHCHHGMTRPQVANGGESHQIWRVAANTLNKQSRTADRGLYSSFGVGRGLATSHRKKSVCYETLDTAYVRALLNAVMDVRVLTPRS